MADKALISRFTPSRTPAEVLEQILVQRESLIADAVERIRESVLSGGTHHLLFVGPRGIGKTHLISLIHHQVQRSSKLKTKLRIAWLNEDETATTFLELLLRMHRALSARYPNEFPVEELDAIFDLSPAGAERQLRERILAGLGNHKLLILVENLDHLFSDLALEGQQHFRAFLQEAPVSILVATSQKLVEGIADRKNPFFGFFQIEHLQSLTLEESRTLLKQIAAYHEDEQLIDFLETDEGRSRLQAIYHLSGGNHRVYIVLSEFISREELDELVNAFEKMLDELTPYYQEKLRSLSAQQRKLVEYLCRCERPTSVKVIARRLFISQQTASSQLKELRNRGYVVSNPSGRESLYELSEPLLKLCVEVKENNREPIRLVVRFLRAWYTDSQLDGALSRNDCSALALQYVRAAIALGQSDEQLKKELGEQFKLYFATLMERLSPISLDDNKLDVAQDSGEAAALDKELERLSSALESSDLPAEFLRLLFLLRAVVYASLREREGAIADLNRVTDIENGDTYAHSLALLLLSSLYDRQGDLAKAMEYCQEILEINSLESDLYSITLIQYSVLLAKANRWNEAWEYLSKFLSNARENPELAAELIEVIAQNTTDRILLKDRVSKLVSLYSEHDKYDWLGAALTRSLKEYSAPPATLPAWKSVWQETIAEIEELSIAWRIFATGIDYLETRDIQVLNELVSEERKVLIDLFELDKK